MSVGSAPIPLLKAAPEPEQLADRLEGGPWRGLEVCLAGKHVADDEALARAIEVDARRRRGPGGHRRGAGELAERRVRPGRPAGRRGASRDRAERRLRRRDRLARADHPPVRAADRPAEFRDLPAPDPADVERFLRFYADACLARGVQPLIENVPPVLRMRSGGVFLSWLGGHWDDLLEWRGRIPELGFTIDTSHAALFRSFCAAYPTLFGLASDEDLDLARYVEELGPAAEVAHVSDAHGLLGEGLPYGSGELDLDPVVRRLGELVPYVVAEINEPDPNRSVEMKAAYRAIERAFASESASSSRARRVPPDDFDWQVVLERRDPVPSLLELQERFGGRRVLMTGGGGSIARTLATFLAGFRPDRITLVDAHEGSLIADRRARDAEALDRIGHVLCDARDGGRLERVLAEAKPDVVFHFAAYKHVDWAEVYPEEFVDTNLQGSWNLLRAADAAGVDTVVVASTDKAALAASFYGRTKRFMEQLAAYSARRGGGRRTAVRFVNVLASAGSASELFLRQARADVPLTVTDTGMLRYWITMAHAAVLAAHATLLAADGVPLATASDPVVLTVGELASRIWRQAGREGEPDLDVLGIRPGETLSEVLIGPGEELGEERYQGIAPIAGEIPSAAPAWVVERLPERGAREETRAVWLEAMRRPGLLAPQLA